MNTARYNAWETLINSADEMKHEAHGTQQPRPINAIGEDASTAQRSDSLVAPINQCFLNGMSCQMQNYEDDRRVLALVC